MGSTAGGGRPRLLGGDFVFLEFVVEHPFKGKAGDRLGFAYQRFRLVKTSLRVVDKYRKKGN